MKVYVRRVMDHDVTHEVSLTNEIVRDFFDGKESFNMTGKKSNQKGIVTINNVTDARFGGKFKEILRYEGNISVDDLIVIYKEKSSFLLEIINKNDERYNTYFNMFNSTQRHLIFYLDEKEIEEGQKNYYIVSASNYDNYHKKIFDTYGSMYWEQSSSKDYKIGDIVYVYCSDNYSKIKLKTVIVDLNIDHNELIRKKYYESANVVNDSPKEKYMNLKLISDLEDDRLSFSNLQKNGFGNQIGLVKGIKIENNNLINYIESIFNSNDSFNSNELSELALGKILRQYYDSKETTKNSGIMLFAIKYGEYIKSKNKDIVKIISSANLDESYKHELYKGMSLRNFVSIRDKNSKDFIYLDEEQRLKKGYNKIYYGIPGCGKSFIANSECMKIVNNDNSLIIRTTFYPDYTNSDFVGQIIPKIDDNDKNSILYDIQSGPFTEALVKAIDNPDKYVCLIIEEINRGSTAAIFGDTFQLLDRNDTGESEYGIKNYIISKYLSNNCVNQNYDFENIKIPSNLILVGTMNTSDQNVFTLDTAFKRRWSMEHISNNIEESKFANKIIPILDVKWSDFVKKFNELVTNDDDTLGINGEDKQIGAYFISGQEWDRIDQFITEHNEEDAAKLFAEKILSYIWEDIAKLDKTVIFKKNYKTFEAVVKDFLKHEEILNINFEKGNK